MKSAVFIVKEKVVLVFFVTEPEIGYLVPSQYISPFQNPASDIKRFSACLVVRFGQKFEGASLSFSMNSSLIKSSLCVGSFAVFANKTAAA